LSVEQTFGDLPRTCRIDGDKHRRLVSRNLRIRRVVFLDLASQHYQRRSHRRRNGLVVGTLNGHQRLIDGLWLGIPFRIAPDHPGHIVRGVRGNEVRIITGDHQDRHTVIVGLVHGHGPVLNSNGAVQQRQHGFALGLGVSMRHGYRRLLVQRGDELRHLVGRIAVVYERLLQTFKTRSRVCSHVFDTELANGLDH